MIEVSQVPAWFRGHDSFIDSVSIFVLLLISFFSIKFYKIKKNRNYLLLGIAFILLAVSFLFKILTTVSAYLRFYSGTEISYGMLDWNNLGSTESIMFMIYFIYHLIVFFGLYVMYSVYQKQSDSNVLLISYLIVISAFFSNQYETMFHLTYLIMMALVTSQTLISYLKKKYQATRLIVYSFMIITFSQLLFVLIELNAIFYIIAEFAQLIGYLSLLIAFIAVLIYGRKENEDRYNW